MTGPAAGHTTWLDRPFTTTGHTHSRTTMIDPTMHTRVYAPGTSSLTCTRHLPGLGQTHARAIRSRTATRSTFSFFFGNAPSAFAIPDSAKLTRSAHTAFPKFTAFSKPFTPSVCFTLSPTRLTLRDALLQLPLAPARARYHPGLARQLRPPGPLHQVTTLTSSPTGSSYGPVSRICLIPAPHTDRSGRICLPRPAP